MVDAVRSPSLLLPLPAPVATRLAAAAPAAVLGADRLERTSGPSLKSRLEPAIALVARAGHPEIAARLRRAHFIETNGKTRLGNVEYYAAAMPGGLVFIDRKVFGKNSLSTAELASVLLHEGVHLRQNPWMKLWWGMKVTYGKQKVDPAEKEAYLVQWSAMKALGLKGGEIYWAVAEALREMGVAVD